MRDNLYIVVLGLYICEICYSNNLATKGNFWVKVEVKICHVEFLMLYPNLLSELFQHIPMQKYRLPNMQSTILVLHGKYINFSNISVREDN